MAATSRKTFNFFHYFHSTWTTLYPSLLLDDNDNETKNQKWMNGAIKEAKKPNDFSRKKTKQTNEQKKVKWKHIENVIRKLKNKIQKDNPSSSSSNS